jgi:hypothetical protein
VVVQAGTFAAVASPAASQNIDRFWTTKTSPLESGIVAAAVQPSWPAPSSVDASKVVKNDASPHPSGVFEFKPSMKRALLEGTDLMKLKPAVTYRVEGYRFKPETQSAIGTSPHPDGTFAFQPETMDIIQSNSPVVPKPKPVAYPVAGFRFDETTKTVIQNEKDRASSLAASSPLESAPTMIVSPSISKAVTVITDGNSINPTPQTGSAVSSTYKALSSSYLDALNLGDKESPSAPTLVLSEEEFMDVIKPMARPSRTGASYLETLSRP